LPVGGLLDLVCAGAAPQGEESRGVLLPARCVSRQGPIAVRFAVGPGCGVAVGLPGPDALRRAGDVG
jgi:hypothetical protein